MEKSHLNRNRKIVLIFASILFLVIIGLSIFFAIDNSHKTATVNILVAPTFATVEINHHKFSTDTTVKYYPGNYIAKISADGFESQEIALELSPDQATDLYLYLTITDSTGGNRDRAINLIREKGFNPNDYEIIYSYVPPEPLP